MADFVGTYKFEKDDGNFDNLLKAIGVGLLTRKTASALTPKIEVSTKDDGSIVIKTITTFKNTVIEFKLDEEFEEQRMDGKSVMTVIKREGNKLVQTQHSDPPVSIIREFNGDKLVTTGSCAGVTCVREYKKA